MQFEASMTSFALESSSAAAGGVAEGLTLTLSESAMLVINAAAPAFDDGKAVVIAPIPLTDTMAVTLTF